MKFIKELLSLFPQFFPFALSARNEQSKGGSKVLNLVPFRTSTSSVRTAALLFFIFPQLTLAAEETIKKSPISSQVGSNVTNVSATSLAQMIVALIFILVAIIALGWFSKRVAGVGKNSGGRIKVISGASVGSRERVVLIQVGQEQMLIGVAPGSVNKLHHFENPVVENAEADPKVAPFAQKLQQLMKNQQMKKNPDSNESVIDASIKEKVVDEDD